MQELNTNFDIISMRQKDAELKSTIDKIVTYEDLAVVDDLGYWELYKQEISELQASSIINLNNDEHINLLLVFYVQSL